MTVLGSSQTEPLQTRRALEYVCVCVLAVHFHFRWRKCGIIGSEEVSVVQCAD